MVKQYNKKNLKYPRKKNKNGIPVFDGENDFFTFFEDSSPSSAEHTEHNTRKETGEALCLEKQFFKNTHPIYPENQSCSRTTKETNSICHRTDRKNKHGIQILDSSENFTGIFQEKKEEDDFSVLLGSSLKGKNLQAMMREKKDKPKLVPISMGKRLKRYPPPQKLLDLHGYTASMAENRAETYIRTCRRNGIFTIRIIVGKGLHSQWGPVLPDIIEDLLIKLKKDDIVLWFKWDRKKKSQSGSLIVYIEQ